ncbi:MAG: type II secretion system protein [Candidatus Acidiferrales bacterium]
MIGNLREINHLPVRKSGFASTSPRRRRIRAIAAGMTLLELIIACAIMLILATTAVPMARVMVVRRKEEDLRIALRQIRTAIDRYKDAADQNKIQVQAGTEGYPPDLATLVNGVQLTGGGQAPGGAVLGGTASNSGKQRIHFLSRIPVDPMTGSTDWGMRSVQDDTDSTSWGGQNVFDVYTKSTGTAMNGTRYSEW